MISKLKEKFVDAVSLEGGFTLIELMIVIAIIGILAAVAIPQLTGVRGEANVSAVQSEMKSLQTNLEMYHVQEGSYPNDLEDMSDVSSGDELLEGPQGEEYIYNRVNSNEYTIDWASSDTAFGVTLDSNDGFTISR